MDYPTWPEISGSDWGERVLTSLNGQRYPLSGSIDLTERCNLNCIHCYINHPAGSRAVRSKEMSTEQVINILNQITSAGCLFLMMTGGEILLRPDFREIYTHARQRGLVLTLFTNGTLVTDEVADTLAKSPPTIIEITLYGATEFTYETITRVRGSYKRCIQGIEKLLSRGLNVTLKSVLMKTNVHELDRMQQMTADYGVKHRYDGVLWPRLDGSIPYLSERLSAQELMALDETHPERQQAWLDIYLDNNKHFPRSEYVYNCGAGFRSFHIDAMGRVTMCLMTRQPAYDLAEMPFTEAWEKLGTERERKRVLHTPCETCNLGALCTQCTGWSQAVHGDLETPVDYVCQLAKTRVDQLKKYCILNN